MKTKLQRESFLMLPANNLEKYAARFLMMSVGSILIMVIATLIGDFVQFILSFFMTPGYHASIIGSSLSQIYKAATNTGDNPICILAGQCKIDAALVGWSFLIMIYSFYSARRHLLPQTAYHPDSRIRYYHFHDCRLLWQQT